MEVDFETLQGLQSISSPAPPPPPKVKRLRMSFEKASDRVHLKKVAWMNAILQAEDLKNAWERKSAELRSALHQ